MLDNKEALKNLLTMLIDSIGSNFGLSNFKINSLRRYLMKQGLIGCLRRLKKIFHQTMFLFGDDIQKKIS